jgi:hypothetical protein
MIPKPVAAERFTGGPQLFPNPFRVLAQDLAIVHPVELIAAQNDIVIDRAFEEIPEVRRTASGFPYFAIPQPAAPQEFRRNWSKIVELEAGVLCRCSDMLLNWVST